MGGKFAANRAKRDGTSFLLLPRVVLDSPGYRLAGHPARSLLIDIAMQYSGHNNGKLTACAKYLKPKGWRSNDTIVRARRELIDCGLLIETRKGARPNRAAWFALSWLDLDQMQGLDIDPKRYRRGEYMTPDKPAGQLASLVLFWVTAASGSIRLNYTVTTDGKQRDASQTIDTQSTPCHFGGERRWFACPVCRNRARVLFLRCGRFACRSCQRIAYRSQSGSASDRIAARFHKLDALITQPKPKWQRRSTRDRLFDKYCAISEKFDAMLANHLTSLGIEGFR